MTSSVISSCALEIDASRESANIGFNVPKASEWRRTPTRDSCGSDPHVVRIAATTSARLASSAALTLKNSARRPEAAISATIRSALACVALRSRWTPKMFHPAFASASEHASPNPEEAPRMTAQRDRFSNDKAPGILSEPPERLHCREVTSRERWLLFAALLLLLVPVWLEPAGSWLAEPDEARYAEIPREMLASHDYVTPRLNGIPYFEKPPLLYWANAASMRLLGATPWAARLPTRFFGLGTVIVLALGTAAAWGAETGLAAGILYLASPYGFLFSRVNLTDAPLTFFFAATLFLARPAIARREPRLPWKALSLFTGLAAAGGFLSKGLVAIVLPGGILLVWCILARRTRFLPALLAGPALPAFLAASAPWFYLAEKRNPGFLDFFFIHEHFQRFAAAGHARPGPVYYFVLVFLAGFLPAQPFFFSALKRSRLAGDRDAQFFLAWFAVVLVFFSVSRSKLPPYLTPAIPAAAALAARPVFA